TFVLLHHVHHKFDKKTEKTITLVKKADWGIHHALSQNFPLNDSTLLDSDDSDGIKVTLVRSYWGVFEKFVAISKFRKNRFIKTALIGGKLDQDFAALYLQDNNRPLVIAGKSKITGKAFLPTQGIRPGGIGGEFYRFKTPIFGGMQQSSSKLPTINHELRTNLKTLLKQSLTGMEKSHMAYRDELKLANSFASPIKFIYGDLLRISGANLAGNIVLKANGTIIIEANSIIKDVLFVAPKIIIENGFKGTLQAIASESINVEKNVVLEYPSALVVESKETPNRKVSNSFGIHVQGNAIINGILAYLDDSDET
ncbi:hypothetical protein GTQ34_16570, partial [Muricauda sp. JGD-17]